MTLEIITADSLAPLRHGFFTRCGGTSSGIFNSLNCGYGSSDQNEAVTTNRARVAQAMQVKPENLITVTQVHSTDVHVVTSEPAPAPPRADAMVCATPGMALGILTADCQPVLFADQQAGVIGAAHAGWKGALFGVLEATLDEMVALGATRRHICAVIGPTIGQRAYEVGAEFRDTFLSKDPDNSRFFENGRDGKYQFDLPSFGLHRLRNAEIDNARWTGHCTYSSPEQFFSYRRSVHEKQADYGRLISVIGL